MKLFVPVVLGAAIVVVAITVAKRREPVPLPERPDGDWEPDRDRTDS